MHLFYGELLHGKLRRNPSVHYPSLKGACKMNLTIDEVYFSVSREDLFSREFVVDDPEEWVLLPCDDLSPMGPCYQAGDVMHDLLDHFREDRGIIEHELMATGAYIRRMQYAEKQTGHQRRTMQSVVTSMVLLWAYAQRIERDGYRQLFTSPINQCPDYINWLNVIDIKELFVRENLAGNEDSDPIAMEKWFSFSLRWIYYGYLQSLVRYGSKPVPFKDSNGDVLQLSIAEYKRGDTLKLVYHLSTGHCEYIHYPVEPHVYLL